MKAEQFGMMIAVAIFIMIIELIRQQKMTFKYSLMWLAGSTLVLLLAFNAEFLAKMGKLAGFAVTSNFVFFLFIAFFVVLSLFLTLYVNEQNNKGETLTQALGILDYKVKKLQEELNKRK